MTFLHRLTLLGSLVGSVIVFEGLLSLPVAAQTMADPVGITPSRAASPGAQWDSNYRLGPGDVIAISVFAAEEYGGEILVLQDGTVNLPRVGRVPVKGLTLEQAADAIASRYAVYIHRPLVTLDPVRLRPVRIAISGEVNRPGSYNIEGADSVNDNRILDNTFPTLTQAISEAGGITAEADLREVEIRRQTGPSQETIRRINLWDLVQSGDLNQDIILQSGDEVFIPTATVLSPEEAIALSGASFAPDTIRIYVAGEVDRPGAVDVPLNTPLNQALLAAGSFNTRANRTNVELVRVNADGTAIERRIPVDFSLGPNAENNPMLKDQDVIVVGRSTTSRIGDFTNNLLSPVTRILNTILGIDRILD